MVRYSWGWHKATAKGVAATLLLKWDPQNVFRHIYKRLNLKGLNTVSGKFWQLAYWNWKSWSWLVYKKEVWVETGLVSLNSWRTTPWQRAFSISLFCGDLKGKTWINVWESNFQLNTRKKFVTIWVVENKIGLPPQFPIIELFKYQ